MKLEATGRAITYRWPGGEVRLERGKPVELPDERAKRLLAKAGQKVRIVASHSSADWLTRWREVATITDGITKNDVRFNSVMLALDECDAAFVHGDWDAFEAAVAKVSSRVGT